MRKESEKIEGWKQIAAHIGRDERTAKRWEATRGLPVHRLPGEQRSSVFAFASELAEWQGSRADAQGSNSIPPSVMLDVRPRATRFSPRSLTAALLAAATLCLGFGALTHRPKTRVGTERPARADGLYRQASLDWSTRTPASLTAALGEYRAAVRIAPNFAEAHAGIARSYELLREFGGMPDTEAYPLAEAAARRALEINPDLAEGHLALGFVLFWWDWDSEGAEREMSAAVRLAPNDAVAHHWLATMLQAERRFPEALIEIRRAEAIDPGSRAARADEAGILFSQGRFDQARSIAAHMVATDPTFITPHLLLAQIAFRAGNYAEYVRQARLAAELRKAPAAIAIATSEGLGEASGGRAAMVQAGAETAAALYAKGSVGAYEFARSLAMAGRDDQAVAMLERARRLHDPAFIGVRIDAQFTRLLARADFQKRVLG